MKEVLLVTITLVLTSASALELSMPCYEDSTSSLCRQLPLASGKKAPSSRSAVEAAPDTCSTCQQVLATIKQALLENKTRDEIAELVKSQACTQLGPLADACEETTDLLIGEVLRTVSMDVMPQQICTLLGLCNQTAIPILPAAAASRAPARAPAKKILQVLAGHPVLQLMRLQATPSDKKPLAQMAGSFQLCLALTAQARQRLLMAAAGARVTPGAAAVAAIRAACQLAPTEAKRLACDSGLVSSTQLIRRMLSSDLPPADICRALGASSPASLPQNPLSLKRPQHHHHHQQQQQQQHELPVRWSPETHYQARPAAGGDLL